MRYKIVIVEDEHLLRKSIHSYLSQKYDCQHFETMEAGREWIEANPVDLILSDIHLPEKSGMDLLRWVQEKKLDIPVILITAYSSVKNAVEAIKQGAADYISKPLDLIEMGLVIERVLETLSLKDEVLYYRKKDNANKGTHYISQSKESEALEDILQRLIRIEENTGEVPSILVTGETGTGKGVIARRIHQESPRAKSPFIDLNCSAITESMFESEIFGHEKGAFTGAVARRVGLFELAHHGTLFLDEIGHAPLSIQTKLLKAIEDKSIRRVGGSQEISVNVRLVAATNLDLVQAVADGEFREDLYHRLKVIHLKLTPLRERSEDIAALAQFFLDQAGHKYHAQKLHLTQANVSELERYPWPGNIRELRNEIERSVLLYDGKSLNFDHLKSLRPLPIKAESDSLPQFIQSFQGDLALSKAERYLVEQALIQTDNDLSGAAELLSTSKDVLRHRIKKHSIDMDRLQGWGCSIPEGGIELKSFEKNIISETLKQVKNNVSETSRILNISRETLRYRIEKYKIPLD